MILKFETVNRFILLTFLGIFFYCGLNSEARVPLGKVNVEDSRNMTPLFYSLAKGESLVVFELLWRGAEVNHIEGVAGMTPLMYSIITENFWGFDFLIQFGARGDMVDRYGNNALMYAADQSTDHFLLKLLDQKLDFSHRNFNGESALTFAAQAQNPRIFAILWLMGFRQMDRDISGYLPEGYFNETSRKIWDCYLRHFDGKIWTDKHIARRLAANNCSSSNDLAKESFTN